MVWLELRGRAVAAPSTLTIAASAESKPGHEAETAQAEDEGAPKKPLNRKHAPKVDPIEANGPIFVDWPKPDAALVITGELMGYIEPCGCAGLTNQKGGLKRRSTFFDQLQSDGWPVVALDAGGQVKRYGPQTQIKFRYALESLKALGYQGIGLGTPDLRMDLLGVAINFEPGTNPLVSANVGVLDFDPEFCKLFSTAEAGGIKFGFTSVLADSQARSLGETPDVTLLPAAAALRRVLPSLLAEKCDQLVLMVYGTNEEAIRLGQQFPQFRWVVSALGADEPPHEPAKVPGTKSILLETGHKGMYAVTIGFYKSEKVPYRYQKVPLDHRFKDADDMQDMLVSYQDELKMFGLDALGAKPLKHPTKRTFAGSQACADCHTSAWEVFEKTPHAHATQTLVDLEPARHFDPECLSCHVVGWEPQKFYPFESGYVSLEATPHLTDQGCENCHGPAARHAAVENGELDVTEEEQNSLRRALHMEIVPNEGNMEGQKLGAVVNNCLQCHDLDNSPDFDFQRYWNEGGIAHEGKD